MNGHTLSGEILDQRITACGVHVEDGAMARIRPFIETSVDLSGTFRLNVVKRSPSGTSTTSQSNVFRAGSLANVTVGIDRPSTVTIDLEVMAANGQPLCRLSKELSIGADAIDL